MSNGIAIRPQVEIIQPRFTLSEMERLSELVSKSNLFKMTPPQVLTLMMIAESEGIHPIQALMRWDIIDGRPAKKGVTVLSEFQAAGGSVKWGTMTEKECEGTFTHPKHCPDGVTVRYTIEDATRAGLAGKDNWRKNPGDMLMWRVAVRGVRRALPGAILGIYDPDDNPDPPAGPSEPEQSARQALAAKLRERAGNARPIPGPVGEAIAAVKEAAALGPADGVPDTGNGECRAWVVDSLRAVNEAILARDPHAKTVHPNTVVNHVIKESIAFGTTQEAGLLRDDGKRDSRAVGLEINRLWSDQNQWVRDVAQEYMLGLVPDAAVAE